MFSAHATDAVPQGGGNAASASSKHVLTTVTIPAAEDATILEVGKQTYIVWSPTLHIPWPRARLQRPAIYFTANLLIGSKTTTKSSKHATSHHEYLAPYEPLPANVLEPLNFDPAFRGKKVYLSEDRITKVSPKGARTTLSEQVVKPLRGASKRAFPTMPALFTRMTYSTVPGGTIASLHIETSQVIAGMFDVRNIRVNTQERVETSNTIDTAGGSNTSSANTGVVIRNLVDVTFPMQMQAGDETVMLYHLEPKKAAADPVTLSVAIQATAILEQGSQIDLDINWHSQSDALRSTPEPARKWSRPMSASLSHQARLSTQSTLAHASSDGAVKHGDANGGITFHFEASPTTQQEHEMALRIKCINKSNRSRRFAALALGHQTPQLTRPAQPAADNADIVAGVPKVPLLGRQKAADVFCDTPDVRIGPILPGACFETEINFRVLASGVLDLGVIRIEDLDTRQTVDIGELPDVVALEAVEGDAAYVPRSTVPRRDDKVARLMEAASQQWHKEITEWMERQAGRTGTGQIS